MKNRHPRPIVKILIIALSLSALAAVSGCVYASRSSSRTIETGPAEPFGGIKDGDTINFRDL